MGSVIKLDIDVKTGIVDPSFRLGLMNCMGK